jgi:hypothetical protein
LELFQAGQRQWILNVLLLLEEGRVDLDLEAVGVLEDFVKFQLQERPRMEQSGQLL